MERRGLYFCCSLYFIGILYITKVYTYGAEGQLQYSNVASTERKARPVQPLPGAVGPWTGDTEFMENPPLMPPYHVFPMFQHVPVPLVNTELFRPDAEKRHLPKFLTSLLVPRPQRIHVSPARNARGVEVWCGHSKISVRVSKTLLGFRNSQSSFHLGSCPVSRCDTTFLYFHYDLNDCDSSLTMINGQIMYSNLLSYTPEPQGTVIRAVPLTLNIQCFYNRFHYSYKMGFLPVVRERMFHKTFEHRAKFSISVCNERWERLEGNGSFVLGEPVYFEVRAAYASKDETVFVDSCYVTASEEPKSTPQYDVISNYGCMEDSRREGSLSRFHQRESNVIRFSVDAFLLPKVTDTNFYLHCSVSVNNVITSATAKSCTYNNEESRWDELLGDSSVCACCDSTCEIEAASASLPRLPQSIITSKPWILDRNEQSLMKTEGVLVSVQEDTEYVRFRKKEGIDEEEDDDYTVEIMTDGKEQMEAKEENKKMRVKDLDEDVEVIFGTEERIVADGPGKEEILEDVSDVIKSGSHKIADITRKEKNQTQFEDFQKDVQIQSTIPSQMVMDEDMFLNAKEEPVEWRED